MAVDDAHVFPSFHTPVLTQLSFQSHRLLFSHPLAEVRGGRKVCLNLVSNSQPSGRKSDTLTTESPGWWSNLRVGVNPFPNGNFFALPN